MGGKITPKWMARLATNRDKRDWGTFILVLAVGVACVYALSFVLIRETPIPLSCSLPGGLECKEYRIYTHNAQLTLVNPHNSLIEVYNLVVTANRNPPSLECQFSAFQLYPSEERILFAECPISYVSVGDKYLLDANVTYSLNGLTYREIGRIVAVIES